MTGRHRYSQRVRPAIIAAAWLLAFAALLRVPQAAGAATPALAVEPDHGTCATEPLIRGAGFPPGQAINLTARAGRDGVVIRFATVTIATDGTFALRTEMPQLEPACHLPDGPQRTAGRQYTILATLNDQQSTVLAQATFSLVTATATLPGLPNTGGGGAQARAWTQNAGLALLALGVLGWATLGRRPRARR